MDPRVQWRRNKNDFFLEVWCVKNYHFFTAPWWSEKALFCNFFFFLNINSDHRSVHLGWFICVFWEFMVKKMINFLAQWHIRVFLEFKLFWIFWFKLLLRLFGSVFHGSQGSMAKCEEIRMIFFWRCDVWKITIFSQPRGGQKRHFFAQFFFFLNIHSDHRSVHLGWFIWVFWEFMVEKMINFPAQWHIKEF